MAKGLAAGHGFPLQHSLPSWRILPVCGHSLSNTRRLEGWLLDVTLPPLHSLQTLPVCGTVQCVLAEGLAAGSDLHILLQCSAQGHAYKIASRMS